MRLFISILLCTAMLLQVMSKTIIASEFALNEKFISETFCENKAKPMMHCNGKCYLKKEMNADEKRQAPVNSLLKEKFEIQFFKEIIPADFSVFVTSQPVQSTLFSETITGFDCGIFHPPSFS